MGLPGYRVVLFRACRGRTPRRMQARPCLTTHGRVAVAFKENCPLGIRDYRNFVAAFPTAHTLARLRFAGRVAAAVARLAIGWAG